MSTSAPLSNIGPKTAFIIGSIVLCVIVVAFLIVVAIFVVKKPRAAAKNNVTVDRMQRSSVKTSSSKHPIARIMRWVLPYNAAVLTVSPYTVHTMIHKQCCIL